MSALPLRFRWLLALSAIFGLLALTSFGQCLAQTPVLLAENQPGTTLSQHGEMPRPAQTLSAHLEDGMYTVDGLVAVVHLQSTAEAAEYMYVFAPGVGTAVLSMVPGADRLDDVATLQGDELAFAAAGHAFRITGIHIVDGEGNTPAPLFVHMDRGTWRLSRRAMVGFGMRATAPYAWPSAVATAAPETLGPAMPVPSRLMRVAGGPGKLADPIRPNPAALQPILNR